MRTKLRRCKSYHGVYFIAEIGQNHQGSLSVAKTMVDSLVGTGVAAIKTAKRDIDTCLTQEQKDMPYKNPNSFGDTYYEHRKALELSKDDFRTLKLYAQDRGFDFISSFTDVNSLDFLVEIGVPVLKIASQRLTDKVLLGKAAATGLTVIISTGMSDITDVDAAIDIFRGNEKYLLQCTSSYPCYEKDIHLRVIETYMERYGKGVDGYGFSGHHVGVAPDIAAFLMGADIIERHYTLHRHWKGSDHAVSLEKQGIEYLLKYISQVREAMGVGYKQVLDCEQEAIKKLRGK